MQLTCNCIILEVSSLENVSMDPVYPVCGNYFVQSRQSWSNNFEHFVSLHVEDYNYAGLIGIYLWKFIHIWYVDIIIIIQYRFETLVI